MRIVTPYFNYAGLSPVERDRLEKTYGDQVREFISANIPEQYRDWPFHLIVGSQELEKHHIKEVQQFIKELKKNNPNKVVLTGVNGHTNGTVWTELEKAFPTFRVQVKPRLEGLDHNNLLHLAKINAATHAADMLGLALADEITVFFRPGRVGALGMLSSARCEFHKKPERIELAA